MTITFSTVAIGVAVLGVFGVLFVVLLLWEAQKYMMRRIAHLESLENRVKWVNDRFDRQWESIVAQEDRIGAIEEKIKPANERRREGRRRP